MSAELIICTGCGVGNFWQDGDAAVCNHCGDVVSVSRDMVPHLDGAELVTVMTAEGSPFPTLATFPPVEES